MDWIAFILAAIESGCGQLAYFLFLQHAERLS
jgi:hypothetical protein